MKTFKLKVRSRNISCEPLKEIRTKIPVIFRMGSVTKTENIIKNNNKFIEINTVDACKLSNDKILMKECFVKNNIPTAEYFVLKEDVDAVDEINKYLKEWSKIIVKHKHSSKGNNIYLIDNTTDIKEFIATLPFALTSYVFEKYYTFSKEYRIHVTKDNYFYTCRKMLKHDAEVRWHRHENNSVWILEENPLFDKPNNWDDIVQSCINALNAIGLDIAAFDIKVQTSNKDNPKWIILESNSAPALGDIGIEKYKHELVKIIESCYNIYNL